MCEGDNKRNLKYNLMQQWLISHYFLTAVKLGTTAAAKTTTVYVRCLLVYVLQAVKWGRENMDSGLKRPARNSVRFDPMLRYYHFEG
jgi:hypothetical protein